MPVTEAANPPESSRQPEPLVVFLDAWAALCATAGRRSLYAARALETGTAAQREALARALVALGYPEATANPRALGGALRGLRGRLARDGRWLDRTHMGSGAVWYVVPTLTSAEAAA